MNIQRGLNTLVVFCQLYKVDYFHDFLFAFLLLKRDVCGKWGCVGNKNLTELPSLKVYPFPLKKVKSRLHLRDIEHRTSPTSLQPHDVAGRCKDVVVTWCVHWVVSCIVLFAIGWTCFVVKLFYFLFLFCLFVCLL